MDPPCALSSWLLVPLERWSNRCLRSSCSWPGDALGNTGAWRKAEVTSMTEARVRLAGLKLPSLLCSGINMCSLPQDKVTQHWLTRGGGGGSMCPQGAKMEQSPLWPSCLAPSSIPPLSVWNHFWECSALIRLSVLCSAGGRGGTFFHWVLLPCPSWVLPWERAQQLQSSWRPLICFLSSSPFLFLALSPGFLTQQSALARWQPWQARWQPSQPPLPPCPSPLRVRGLFSSEVTHGLSWFYAAGGFNVNDVVPQQRYFKRRTPVTSTPSLTPFLARGNNKAVAMPCCRKGSLFWHYKGLNLRCGQLFCIAWMSPVTFKEMQSIPGRPYCGLLILKGGL